MFESITKDIRRYILYLFYKTIQSLIALIIIKINNMELPYNYTSWLQFAKECLTKYPDVDTVKSIYNNYTSIFNVKEIYSEALKELFEHCNFNGDTVNSLRIMEHSACHVKVDHINDVFDLLFKLAKINNDE